MNTFNADFKTRAHDLVDQLPDNATWYDLMFTAGERYDEEAARSLDHVAEEALPSEYYDPGEQ